MLLVGDPADGHLDRHVFEEDAAKRIVGATDECAEHVEQVVDRASRARERALGCEALDDRAQQELTEREHGEVRLVREDARRTVEPIVVASLGRERIETRERRAHVMTEIGRGVPQARAFGLRVPVRVEPNELVLEIIERVRERRGEERHARDECSGWAKARGV